MGLTLTLTDQDLPASPAFIEFLYSTLTGEDFYAGEWFRQEDESLASNKDRFVDITAMASYVSDHPEGKKALVRSYRFFKELLTGNVKTLQVLAKYRFFFIIGIPRTGGTYLTKQLFRASGIDYTQVQNALAHDGFPHMANLTFKDSGNIHTNGLLQLGEYLTMVDMYFSQHSSLTFNGGTVVPKKFTKAVYNFDLIRTLFGVSAEYIVTLRHPLSVCRSILDKSGGMPEDGLFAVRSAIERWAHDDWIYRGKTTEDLRKMEYVEVVLGYWKRFQFQIATSGIPGMPTTSIVPYGEEWMTGLVKEQYSKFNLKMEPEAFKVADPWSFDDRYVEMASKVMDEVEMFWGSLGYAFPREALNKGL